MSGQNGQAGANVNMLAAGTVFVDPTSGALTQAAMMLLVSMLNLIQNALPKTYSIANNITPGKQGAPIIGSSISVSTPNFIDVAYEAEGAVVSFQSVGPGPTAFSSVGMTDPNAGALTMSSLQRIYFNATSPTEHAGAFLTYNGATGVYTFNISNTPVMSLSANGLGIGAAAATPGVSGSCGGIVALQNLCAALAAQGYIINLTTP